VCLIGAQGTQYLPAPIQRECREQRIAGYPYSTLHQTFRYLRHYPQLRNRLTLHQAQRIHEQSEGLPLYLHYIAEELSLTPVQVLRLLSVDFLRMRIILTITTAGYGMS